MDEICPDEVIRNIYRYDSTYKHIFDKVLLQLTMHCFIYRCSECFKPYNQCFSYCKTCRTYSRFCRQLYFADGDMTEDDVEDIVGLGIKIRLSICLIVVQMYVSLYYIRWTKQL